MIERFTGVSGDRLLLDALRLQTIVNGNGTIAQELLEVAELNEVYDQDTVIIQGAEDTDIFFVISGSLKILVNGRVVATRKAGTHVEKWH